jgi:hypothetical protein
LDGVAFSFGSSTLIPSLLLEDNLRKISSLIFVVSSCGPDGSFLEAPNFFNFFLSATT